MKVQMIVLLRLRHVGKNGGELVNVAGNLLEERIGGSVVLGNVGCSWVVSAVVSL